MDRYLIKRAVIGAPQSISSNSVGVSIQSTGCSSSKKPRIEFNIDDVVVDLGKQKQIDEYDSNIRDQVRMTYLQRGPCQPLNHGFPRRKMGQDNRCFRPEWFKEFEWLEYSVEKNAAFCLWCYLLKPNKGDQGGGDVFIKRGFRNWKKKQIIVEHIGKQGSSHNDARRQCEALKNKKQSVSYILSNQSLDQLSYYRSRLTSILDCIRFLSRFGISWS